MNDRFGDGWKAAGLLLASNVFMTLAWYGHLRFFKERPLWFVVVVAWLIAFFEYCLQVPANRIGHRTLSAFQLKVMQEALSLGVFIVFAAVVLGEKMQPKYGVSFALLLAAVVVAFR